jgi:hypothetical protein
MGHLLQALEDAYRVLGFEDTAGGDEVFRHLMLARIMAPVRKLDSPRVLEADYVSHEISSPLAKELTSARFHTG